MARLAVEIPARYRRKREKILANARAIAVLVESESKEALGIPYPPASRPGEAPAKRTGNLQRREEARVVDRWPVVEVVMDNSATYAEKLLAAGRTWRRPVIERLRTRISKMWYQGIWF